MGGPRSLLLITVDCLRAGHVGFLGYNRNTTPFLDSLAGDSLVLPNAIVAGNPTYYSFPAIMASRYPLALGRDIIGLAPGESTLATTLHHSGYTTAAFLAGNVYLSARFGYDSGFETFNDFLGKAEITAAPPQSRNPGLRSRFNQRLARISEQSEVLGSIYSELYFRYCQWISTSPEVSFEQARRAPAADVLVDQACEWLAALGGKPFFLWLHLMDTHAPYYPGEEALRLLGEPSISAARAIYLNSYWQREGLNSNRYTSRKQEIVTLYDAAIRWVDAQVARLVGRLRALRLWEDCVFSLTADHGEEFLDHGGRFHSPAKVNEELIRVPLMMYAPQALGHGVRDNPFSFLDLAPTLLAAMGNPAPVSFRGCNRANELRHAQKWPAPTVTESVTSLTNRVSRRSRLGPRIVAVREERFKLVFDFGTRQDFLFDLRADPEERRPLPVSSYKEVRVRLLRRVADHLSDSLRSSDSVRRLGALLRDIRSEASGNNEVGENDTVSETVSVAVGIERPG